jgi:hypothetical protein
VRLGQESDIGARGIGTVGPYIGVDFGEVDGAVERARPVGVGGVEVRVGD